MILHFNKRLENPVPNIYVKYLVRNEFKFLNEQKVNVLIIMKLDEIDYLKLHNSECDTEIDAVHLVGPRAVVRLD